MCTFRVSIPVITIESKLEICCSLTELADICKTQEIQNCFKIKQIVRVHVIEDVNYKASQNYMKMIAFTMKILILYKNELSNKSRVW